MARKPETVFTAGVHKHLPKKILHFEKMSNPYRGGTWDLWYSGSKADLWIEYKFLPKLPVRVPVRPHELLSDLQLEWGGQRYYEGRNVAVIIGHPQGGVVLEKLSWLKDISAQDFSDRLQSQSDLARWIVGRTMQGELSATSPRPPRRGSAPRSSDR